VNKIIEPTLSGLSILAVNGSGELLCPLCGFNYVHLHTAAMVTNNGGVALRADGEDEAAQVRSRPISGNSGGRRYLVEIKGECENGCTFAVLLRQHNGVTETQVQGNANADERAKRLYYQHLELGSLCESPPESLFWNAFVNLVHIVRAYKHVDEELRPQVKVGGYRIDFGVESVKFGVEIDGLKFHNGQDSFVKDRSRQRELERGGWRIIRFAAKEVLADADKCAAETREALAKVRREHAGYGHA